VTSKLLEAAQVINPFGVPHGQAMAACEQVAAAVCNAGHDRATACNCEDKLKKLLKDFEDQRKLQQQKTGVVVASGKHNSDLDTVALLLDESFQDKIEKKESKTAKELHDRKRLQPFSAPVNRRLSRCCHSLMRSNSSLVGVKEISCVSRVCAIAIKANIFEDRLPLRRATTSNSFA